MFVRDPSRLPVAHPRLTVVQGDVLDPASVEEAMRGQEAMLCALGHGSRIGSVRWTVRISRADVAEFMLDRLESGACLRAAPGVCGRVSERLRAPTRALGAWWHRGAEPNRS